MTEPRFEIYMDKADEFRFRLISPEDNILLLSEGYTSKQNCVKGIQSVKENSRLVDEFTSLVASDGRHYFTLKAGNGEIIGVSTMFEDPDIKDLCIISCMRHAKMALIEDTTL